MTEDPKPFIRHGTKEEPIEVSADVILLAIAAGRDISLEYTIIANDLSMGKVKDQLRQVISDQYGGFCISPRKGTLRA